MTHVVVVAEDEELIRDIAVEALTEAGFTVFEAVHAEEALQHLHNNAANIHLLFTDIHMPGLMNGLALAHHTKSHWPWIALLIASGRPQPAEYELPEGCRFLAKPYGPTRMIAHARELVEML